MDLLFLRCWEDAVSLPPSAGLAGAADRMGVGPEGQSRTSGRHLRAGGPVSLTAPRSTSAPSEF